MLQLKCKVRIEMSLMTPAVLPRPGKVTVQGTFADKMQSRLTAHREAPRRFHSFRKSRENIRTGYSFGRSKRYRGKCRTFSQRI